MNIETLNLPLELEKYLAKTLHEISNEKPLGDGNERVLNVINGSHKAYLAYNESERAKYIESHPNLDLEVANYLFFIMYNHFVFNPISQ